MGNSPSNSGPGDEQTHVTVTGDIRSDGDERKHRPVITELANSEDEAEASNRKSHVTRRAPEPSPSYNTTRTTGSTIYYY